MEAGVKGMPDAGGSDGGPVTEHGSGDPIQFRRDIQPIFDRACNGCHQLFSPHLVAAQAMASLKTTSRCQSLGANTPLVVPGHPERSYLFFKLTGATALTITDLNPNWKDCEQLMPPSAFKSLTDGGQQRGLIATAPDDVERIRQWIVQGALDD